MSLSICVSELNIIWKKISELKENKITNTILETKSLKFELESLKVFKNSIGINSKKIDAKNIIKNQNKPWPFQAIILESTLPVDSKRR